MGFFRRELTPEQQAHKGEREALAAEVRALTVANADREAYALTFRALTCEEAITRRHLTQLALQRIVRDKDTMQPPLPDPVVSLAERVLAECAETGFGSGNSHLFNPVLGIVLEHGYRSDGPQLTAVVAAPAGPAGGVNG